MYPFHLFFLFGRPVDHIRVSLRAINASGSPYNPEQAVTQPAGTLNLAERQGQSQNKILFFL